MCNLLGMYHNGGAHYAGVLQWLDMAEDGLVLLFGNFGMVTLV